MAASGREAHARLGMPTAALLAVALLAAWAAWCLVTARRWGPAQAALTAVPLVVFLLLVVQAAAGLTLVVLFGEQPTAGEKGRAALWSGTAAAVATAVVAGLAAWVRRAQPDDSRAHAILAGTALAVALWGAAVAGMQAA